MKILVTGAAGYIGSVLVQELLHAGYEVRAVDNFLYNQNSLGHVCGIPDLEIVRGDVRDIGLMRRLVSDMDVIIPLAALVGAPLCKKDPHAARMVNCDAILDLFDLLSEDQFILMPTTNSAYGSGAGDDNFCDENSPLNPISQYAEEKVLVEKALMSRKNAISFRLATVFGSSPRPRFDLLVNDFVRKAIVDSYIVLFESHFKRNYIHVRDVCSTFLFALDRFDDMKQNIFNVGLSDANLSKLELCERIKKQVPSFVIYQSDLNTDPDQRNYIVSNAKLESLGWKPSFSIDDGIREMVKFLQCVNFGTLGNV